MQKKLIVPALLAMGFAGGTLPVPAFAQSQDGNQSQNQSQNRSGASQASDGAYQRYLRQLHQELMRDNAGRQGGDSWSGSGSQGRQYGGQQSGGRQSGGQQSDREQFMRGYMAGREEERRRREMSSSQGGGSQSGNQYGSQSGSRGGNQGGSSQGSDGRQQSSQASDQDSRGMFIIPNVYPDSVPFQQFAVVPNYSRSMDHLLVAAQSLREAIQDLAQQPAGERRNQAISEMQDALLETQQAMMRIPPDMR
ncbi:hypothetical protein [Falsiroseomonas sp. E2-1-a20]|uniref:hypothetical protein n=1 Tax=Falsiroseomonas sp. E2-1-a20 TaxID=3239300 RepID=UPI003F3F34EB